MTVTINSATTIRGQTQAGGLVPTVSADFTLLTANNLPSWLSFSRTTGAVSPLFGNAMQYDQNGYLTWAPANLLLRSQDFANAAWDVFGTGAAKVGPVTAPDGSNTAYEVSLGTIGGSFISASAFFQNFTAAVSGTKYILSVYVRAKSGTTSFRLGMNLGSGSGLVDTGDVSLTTAWQRVSVIATATSSGANISLRNNVAGNSSNIFVWGAQLEPVTYQTTPRTYQATTSSAWYGARLDYDPSVVPARARGLLIEEESTNLARWTNSITDVNWTSTYEVTTPSTTIAPDGTNTAYLAQETTNNTLHYVAQPTLSVTSGASYTLSCYVKYAGTRYVFIQMTTSPGATLVFDFNTATIASGNGTATNVGNGWYRISTTYTTNTTSFGYLIIGLSNTTSVSAYAGNTSNGVYLWGAQHEQKAFATSYVPNNTSSSSGVTRAADVAQLTGSALTTLQGANWTFLGEVGKIPSASVVTGVIGSGTGANAVRFNGTSTDLISIINSGGSYGFATPLNATVNNNRIGLSGNSSGTSSVASNGTIVTGGVISWPSGTALGYGAYSAGNMLNSTYRSIAIYNQRLPDATLQTLSTLP